MSQSSEQTNGSGRAPVKAPAKSKNDSKPKHKHHKPRKPQQEKKEIDPTKNYRYLQIKKLIKKFSPITINGISIPKLCEQTGETEASIATDKYLLNLIANQPNQSIYLSFIMIPSDPDFPFDLEMLKISLCIPPKYPYSNEAKPSIYVLNEEIPRGFAVNIELGFKTIVSLAISNEVDEDIKLVEGKGLLSQIKTLDKYLEVFLKQEKRRTVKFVKGKKPISQASSIQNSPSPSPSPAPVPAAQKQKQPQKKPEPVFEDDPKRQEFINQLNLKMKSDIKLFNKNRNSERYKITIPINSKYDLPMSWINYGRIELLLTIPRQYPNIPLSIEVFNKFSAKMNALEDCKKFETSLVHNFTNYEFTNKNIVSILNQVSNNLSVFCLEESQFQTYKTLTTTYAEAH